MNEEIMNSGTWSDLQRLAPEVDTELGLAALRGACRRRQRRTRVLRAVFVGGAVIGLASGLARLDGSDPATVIVADGSATTTTTAPAPLTTPNAAPLEPRAGASVIWTGSEMIVTGGFRQGPGGDTTNVELLTDGAAFEPISSTWRPIADQPEAIGTWVKSYWTGELVLVIGSEGGLAYDPAEDNWTTLTAPPFELPDLLRDNLTFEATWSGGSLIVWRPDTDQIAAYNLETERWSELPGPGLPASYPATLLADEGRLVALASGWPSSPSLTSWDVHAAEWTEGGWRLAEPVTFATDLNANVAQIDAAALVDSSIIVWGDHSADPGPTWVLDAAGRWSEAPSMPVTSGKIAGSLIVDDRVLAVTEGPEVALFAPDTGTWARAKVPFASSYPFSIWTGTEVLGWDGASAIRWIPPEPD